MDTTVLFLLIVPLIVFLFLAYQYKNPYLLFFSAIMTLFIGSMLYTNTIFIPDGSKICDVVVNTSTTTNATTTFSYMSFCYKQSNATISFNQVLYGTLFMLLSLYLIYQSVLSMTMKHE